MRLSDCSDSIRFKWGKLNIDYCASLSLADIEGIYLGSVSRLVIYPEQQGIDD